MTAMSIISMIIKMSAVTMLYVMVTFVLWKNTQDKESTFGTKIAIGVLYGILSIFSTHFAIDFGDMLINVRDLGPMSAGLFFDPVSGIVAGLIGGVERYIAGTYFGVGSYTRVACSISTILAGFLAAFLRIYLFKEKKPSVAYAFFMGAVIEVFHMYVVFVTHREDINMAFYVVRVCSVPMIIFSGLGLALISLSIRISLDGWSNPFIPIPKEKVPVSNKFQTWLFGVTVVVLLINFGFNYAMQTQYAMESAKGNLEIDARDISTSFEWIREHGGHTENFTHHVGVAGSFVIVDKNDKLLAGTSYDKYFNEYTLDLIKTHETKGYFTANVFGEDALCILREVDNDALLFAQIPMSEVFEGRDAQAYETMLGDILLFTVIYVLISLLVQGMVVDNLVRVNKSLNKITDGDLNEKVNVYNSSEFASLSDDINITVEVLKGYIDAAEKRIEQELQLAHTIQDSALPKNFTFAHGGFEVYATMDPAREVGGDFYDVFFTDADKIALVVADVSGKGIPAALFMMRSKTAIRSLAEGGVGLAEIFRRVNNELCEGNDINMFVTVWMGLIDLKTGVMRCVNAGHEYPAIMRKYGSFEIFRDKHRPPLGAMEDLEFEEYEITLEPDDILYVYSDGVPEAINTAEEQYGTDRMLAVLNSHRDAAMADLLREVKKDMDLFVGEAEQFDDITMLGFRVKDKKEKERI